MILAYNKCKAGIDISDQLASYVTTLRKGVEWFRKLGIELLLGVAIVNALLIYKEVTDSRINIRSFRSSIARALLGVSLEQKRSPKQTHILTRRVDEQGKRKTLTCKPCYKKLSNEQGRETAKKIKKLYTIALPVMNSPKCAFRVSIESTAWAVLKGDIKMNN